MEEINTLGMNVENEEIPKIQKTYGISKKCFTQSFGLFQRLFARKRNIILTVIFSLIIADCVYQMIRYPDYIPTCILMILVSASLIFIIWNNARLLTKNFEKSLVDVEKDTYFFKLYDGYLTISSELYVSDEDKEELRLQMETEEAFERELEEYIHPPRTMMNLDTDNMKVIDAPEMFLLYLKKTVFHTLPKSAFDDAEIDILKKEFSSRLGKYYRKTGEKKAADIDAS